MGRAQSSKNKENKNQIFQKFKIFLRIILINLILFSFVSRGCLYKNINALPIPLSRNGSAGITPNC